MEGFKRITPSVLAVAEALVDAHMRGEEIHGYGLIEATGLGGPTVYGVLDRFEEAQLIEARWEERNPTPGKPARRLYRLNADGLAQARQLLAERRPVRSTAGRRAPKPGLNSLIGELLGERVGNRADHRPRDGDRRRRRV